MGNRAGAGRIYVRGQEYGQVTVTNSANVTTAVLELAPSAGYAGFRRAQIIQGRLNALFASGANLEYMTPGCTPAGDYVVHHVPWGSEAPTILATATPADADHYGDTRWHLALAWANALRMAVDRPPTCYGGQFELVDRTQGVQPVLATLETLATYYGYDVDYAPTASGECFHPFDATCAMWAMNPSDTCSGRNYVPFGTFVRVTNLQTGLQAMVRVTDRGPAKYIACGYPARQIDLSHGAALAIGFDLDAGRIPVRVEQLS